MDDIVNPQDAELEEIVLGACLIESKAITLVAGILRPEVFYIEKNREIYAALQSMYRAGQVIDLMTVKEELTQRGKLDFIGGPYALVSITTRVASSAHLEYHARILQQKYIRREAILGFHKLLAQAADETTDIADTLADAHTLLDQLEKECGMSEHLRSMLQLMEDTVELIETRVASNKNGVTGLPTGFNELNRLTCGWQPGDLVVIAARPSVGKTAFSLLVLPSLGPSPFLHKFVDCQRRRDMERLMARPLHPGMFRSGQRRHRGPQCPATGRRHDPIPGPEVHSRIPAGGSDL